MKEMQEVPSQFLLIPLPALDLGYDLKTLKKKIKIPKAKDVVL